MQVTVTAKPAAVPLAWKTLQFVVSVPPAGEAPQLMVLVPATQLTLAGSAPPASSPLSPLHVVVPEVTAVAAPVLI